MDGTFCRNDLQIVLVGRKGTGKSASGNNILMKKVFEEKLVTSECQKDTAEINGRHVTVIDTPGLFNKEITNEEIERKIRDFFSTLPKPDVFLSVMQVGDFNKVHEREVVNLIQKTFGENAMENAMVLFTKVDVLKDKTIEQYLLEPNSTISRCVKKYGKGYHEFNNTQTEDRSQVMGLLEKIDKNVQRKQKDEEHKQMANVQKQGKKSEEICGEREQKTDMNEDNEQEPTTCEVSETGEHECNEQKAVKTPTLRDNKEERKGNESKEEEMKNDDNRMKIEISINKMEQNNMKTQERRTNQDKDTEREHKTGMNKSNEQEPTKYEISETGEHECNEQKAVKTPTLRDNKEERKGNETEEEEMKNDDNRMKMESSTTKTEQNGKKKQERRKDQNKDNETVINNYQKPTKCEVSNIGEHECYTQKEKKTPSVCDKKEKSETEEEMKKDGDGMKIEISISKMEQNDMKTQERRTNQDKDTEREHKTGMNKSNEQAPTKYEISETGEHECNEQKAVKTPTLRDNKEERKGNETEEEIKNNESSISKIEQNDMNTWERRTNRNKDIEREHKTGMDENTCEVLNTGEHECNEQKAVKTPTLCDEQKERRGTETDEAEIKKDEETMKIKSSIDETEQNDMETKEEDEDQKKGRKSKESGKQQEFNRENEPQTMYNKLHGNKRQWANEENWFQEQNNTKKQLKMNEEQNEARRKGMTAMAACYSERDPCIQMKNTQENKHDESEKNEQIANLFNRLNLKNRHQDKLTTDEILHITKFSVYWQEPRDETELIHAFLRKLLRINYMARYTSIKCKEEYQVYQVNCTNEKKRDEIDETNNKLENQSEINFKIHPMDVQMAVFHCADSFLKQLMVTKLSQCQYALPLLVPDPFTQQLDFPLWTFRQINKSWNMKDTNNEIVTKTQPVCKAKTPMVAFFRFGSVSSSKSQLMSSLINEKHNMFFHRNCKGSSRTRILMDGVVEIAWFCPSGKDDDKFTDCVAFCNLHGDAGANEKQLNILSSMASVNVVLLPQLDRNDKNATKIQMIYKNSTTVICLLDESNSSLTLMRKGKYKIGLKDRSQAEVTEELRRAINDSLSLSSTGSCCVFRLEDVATFSGIRVDERDDDSCKKGKHKAQEVMSLLEKSDLTEIKESFLPCQGNLWHQWCQKNKELHRPQRNETEMDTSVKKTDLKKIREQQQASDSSEFMKLFLKEMNSLNADEKKFFLKWLGILLDEHTSEELSSLRKKYNKKCSEVLKLKTNNGKPEHLAAEQRELKAMSKDINSANFGLVHILREIGQIYESCSSVKKNKDGLQCHFSLLPSLAAEMMISGFPLELMDGDASHVPLIWVTAVFDELVKKLGNLRVFVLSVLGIQSTGKSTLLNTMFGLQFAVSAGRCTRGAFMQLVKVSDEMKTQLKFDYILVVDTEGLCSLELSGRENRDHDNELATFVAGLGNLTLINIFGESLAEMQNILQIVVQGFLRMKQVKLNSHCIFVHQNVSDITAKDKNMEGKKKLLEELDEMTELAAKDDVCDVQSFKDVIKFDALNDVKYCAQLWEGNPPMAPPNPNYSENVQELKETIFLHASQSDGMMLKHLKQHMDDLCEALLNERFVFSFKNSLEVLNYRKIETEYSKWSWKLKNSMLEIEDNLRIKIINGVIYDIKDNDLEDGLKETSEEVKKSMSEFFKEHKNASMLYHWKVFENKIKELQESIVKESKRKLNEVIQQQDMNKKIDAQRTHYENIIFEQCKQHALRVKDSLKDEKILKEKFEIFWKVFQDNIRKDSTANNNTDILRDMYHALSHMHEDPRYENSDCTDMTTVSDYSNYVTFKKSKKEDFTEPVKCDDLGENQTFVETLSQENELQINTLVKDIVKMTEEMMMAFSIAQVGYKQCNYFCQLTDYIKKKVKEHEEGPVTYVFKKEFTMDLTFQICKRASKIFTDQQRIFRETNDPALYFERKREEYYSIFQKYCHGATSSVIFGEFICNKLKEPIQQSVYKKTARELANEIRSNCEPLNGNRSKLEKHILKVLAEKENFDMYMTYIHNPREFFKFFIRDEVSKYILEKFSVSILPKIKEDITLHLQKITEAAHEASKLVEVKNDVDSWINHFTSQLSELLILSKNTFTGVSHNDVDISLLGDMIRSELSSVKFDTSRTFMVANFLGNLDCKDRPDAILIEHFCQCCWVQCPFCKAICTNTVEKHHGDHSVPFHRNVGLNGWYFRGTTNLSVDICTSEVARNNNFSPYDSGNLLIPWREYRTAGPKYATWSITPDFSELPYWKWVVCRFQKDLENKYKKTFLGSGNIPNEWREYTKQEAIESLNKYYQ